MQKRWLVLVGIIVGALILWWAVNTTSEINQEIQKSSVENSSNSESSENAEAKNLHIVETESGKKVWELTADKAIYSDKNAKLINVRGKFFSDNNEILLTFKAPEGNYVEKFHQLSLNKGAYVQHPEEHITISSDTMYWSNEKDDITAEKDVVVDKNGKLKSRADKCIFSTDFTNIKLEGNTYSQLSM
ncbi:MAG: LPS export ABC transporter periplasmic protein LptC [Vampirovibrionia bacterium]